MNKEDRAHMGQSLKTLKEDDDVIRWSVRKAQRSVGKGTASKPAGKPSDQAVTAD